MGVLTRVGRKRPAARLGLGCLYLLLLSGAVSTLYPFLMMVSTGLTGPTDQNENRLVPSYLVDDEKLLSKYLDDKYAGDLDRIAATRTGVSDTEADQRFATFLESLPDQLFEVGFRQPPAGVTSRLSVLYQANLRKRFRTIEALDAKYIEEATGFEVVTPPTEQFTRLKWTPRLGPKQSDWIEFKRTLPPEFRLPVTLRETYQRYLRDTYHNDFKQVPADIRFQAGGEARTFGQIRPPLNGPRLREFEQAGIPRQVRRDPVELRWLKFTGRSVPKGIDPIVAAASVVLPIESYERSFVRAHARSLRAEFAGRNFAYVFNYLTENGGAALNTAIYCCSAIVVTLFINVLAAYALSRYPIKASGQILIFLLATMAFPAEVTMIPNFLLLKNLHLLNTFAALVLPTAASGYMIFLLKGFFDSLPQELFEAGAIDGAKESTMLAKIALPLSRPVLGYFSLLIFLAAYGNFIYAFLVAQDRRIWTIMVFVYQLGGIAPKSVMMAAFTLAAIPTLAVFLLAQRTILRGIVLPGER